VRRRGPHPAAPTLSVGLRPSRVGRREKPVFRQALREKGIPSPACGRGPHPSAIHPGFALTLSFLRPKTEKKEIHCERDGAGR
jgi:hypothetical protein